MQSSRLLSFTHHLAHVLRAGFTHHFLTTIEDAAHGLTRGFSTLLAMGRIILGSVLSIDETTKVFLYRDELGYTKKEMRSLTGTRSETNLAPEELRPIFVQVVTDCMRVA